MADLFHWWGSDLTLTPSGDLQTVDSLPKDNQRIFRRLCTNGGLTGAEIAEYLFHPTYGGSAPWYVGRTTQAIVLTGLMRAQMYLETSVSHSPEPILTPNFNPDGSYNLHIQYWNADTGERIPPLVVTVSS